nr:aldehyde dehydrogenase family protein [Pseudomonas sp. SZ57]
MSRRSEVSLSSSLRATSVSSCSGAAPSSDALIAGMTHINDITIDDQPNAPFGGEKNSGLGRFNGQYAVDEFTRAHWVTWKAGSHHYPF